MNNLNKLKVIIFDFDGTLVDTMGIFADVAATLIQKNYGWEYERARGEYLRTSGLPFIKQLEELLPSHPNNQKVADEFEKTKNEAAKNIILDPEILASLNELHKKYKIAISSGNFVTNIENFFAKHSFAPDLIMGFKDHFNKGPEHFNFVLQTFNVQKDEVLFVGDSLHDFLKAREFGLAFIAKLGTFTLLDFQKIDAEVKSIQSIKELKNYV